MRDYGCSNLLQIVTLSFAIGRKDQDPCLRSARGLRETRCHHFSRRALGSIKVSAITSSMRQHGEGTILVSCSISIPIRLHGTYNLLYTWTPNGMPKPVAKDNDRTESLDTDACTCTAFQDNAVHPNNALRKPSK